MKTSTKATLALLGTVLLWSHMVVITRGIVAFVPPITVLFYRLLIAALCFMPFFLKNRTWEKPHFIKMVLISLGATINLTFFILGIKYTSASASQIIYATMPILILSYGRFILKEKQTRTKIIGILIGFLGLLLIGYLSAIEQGETISGSLRGNFLIFVAMSGWTWYLLSSKKLSANFLPIEMGSTSILVSFLVSSVLFIINQSIYQNPISFSPVIFMSLLYIGFFGTFITYILYQYAIRHSSALKVSLTSYIQPVTTAFLAILLLGEQLTFYFIIGSVMVLIGIFITSSVKLDIFKKFQLFD